MTTKTRKTSTPQAPETQTPQASPLASGRPNVTILQAGGGLCWCGCGQHTIRPEARFISGHDAKLKGMLQRVGCGITREGDHNIETLRSIVAQATGNTTATCGPVELAEMVSPGWGAWVVAAQDRHEAEIEAKAEKAEAKAAAKAARAAEKEAEAKAEAAVKAANKAAAEKAKTAKAKATKAQAA